MHMYLVKIISVAAAASAAANNNVNIDSKIQKLCFIY